MVAVGGTDSADTTVDSDFAAHMVDVVHTEADIGSDTNWAGIAQADSMLASIQPDYVPHSSSNMCRSSSPSGVGMLCNPSLHSLLTCRIYRTGLWECL